MRLVVYLEASFVLTVCSCKSVLYYYFISFSGEELEKGIQNAIILEADEALLLTAQEEFDDILPDGKYTLFV